MLILQITEAATNAASTLVPAAEQKLSLFELIMKGGWVMIPIAILSIIGVYIFVERYLTIRKASKDETQLLSRIRENVSAGKLDTAMAICRQTDSPTARMLQKGLVRIGKPIKEIEGAIENVGKLEVSKLEKNIPVLGIIAGIAPMFGFLGTISGVIKIFYNISLSDNISIGQISEGLYEKMISSASGLLIGIIAYVGHNVLNIMVDKLILRMETEAIEFIDLLEDPGK